MKRLLWGLAAVLAAAPTAALEIDFGVNPARHYRFTGGFGTAAPTSNAGVLGGGLDLSGVGWSVSDPTWGVTLLTPDHIAIATHVAGALGSQVSFLNRDGVVKTYGISGFVQGSYNGGGSDVMIATLTTPVAAADHVTTYGVLKSGPMPALAPDLHLPPNPAGLDPSFAWYVGRSMVVVGKNESSAGTFNPLGGKVGRDTIAEVGGYTLSSTPGAPNDTIGVSWLSSNTTPDSTRLIGGDSGSPSFLEYNGSLYYMGSHSGIGPAGPNQLNVDGFMPWYVDALNASIFGSGFQIAVFTPVPEPGSLALAGAALAGAWTVRRRRRASA